MAVAVGAVSLLRSTPPSREATGSGIAGPAGGVVAIHAPLAGGDNELRRVGKEAEVAIHAPLAGGDWTSTRCTAGGRLRSTPPSREATLIGLTC